MTTLEIVIPLSAHKRLLRHIAKILPNGAYMHFMLEEKSVVVRTDQAKVICAYLHKKKIKHKHYAYPFGKGYGESKKGVVYRHFAYFLATFSYTSHLALHRKKRDDFRLIERATHTMINQFGYGWLKETAILLELARGRVGVIRKYERHSLASELICTFIMWWIRIALRLLVLLK